jgi:malonyl-CoA O-methyltransferase
VAERPAHFAGQYTAQMNGQAIGLDPVQVRRAFERAAAAGGDSAVLQREVERRMFERLDYIRCRPHRVLDSGCGVGRGLKLLRRRYPEADLFGVDFARGVLREAKRNESLFERALRLVSGSRRFHVCADFVRLPIRTASLDMVWSNLALAWAGDPLAALREVSRVLIPGGLLMFSSYGPDTLKELKAAFGAGSAARHVHSFIDMHDIGDMLVASGFAAPVMDMEVITLTYSEVASLLADIKASGATCAARDRQRGLMGRRAWERMLASYERERREGRLPATIEVVYGHAWKGEQRTTVDGRHIIKVELDAKKSR